MSSHSTLISNILHYTSQQATNFEISIKGDYDTYCKENTKHVKKCKSPEACKDANMHHTMPFITFLYDAIGEEILKTYKPHVENSKILKDQFLQCLDDMQGSIFTSPKDIQNLKLLKIHFKAYVPEDLRRRFTKYMVPWKNMIKKRDEKFFTENTHIFGNLPPEDVEHYAAILPTIDNDDKRVLWDYFELFLGLCL